MATERLDQTTSFEYATDVSAPRNGADFLSMQISTIEIGRPPTPINDYDIVVPPSPYLECIGDDCRFRKSNKDDCGLNCHHLHSTEPSYLAAGELPRKFRELPTLTVWMHECQHYEHHSNHDVNVEIPCIDVMERCIEETRFVREFLITTASVNTINRNLSKEGLSRERMTNLHRRKELFLSDRRNKLRRINEIEVLPEQLVTGALLLVAPNHARSRIYQGTGFALTGTLKKQDAPRALENGDDFTKLADEHWAAYDLRKAAA